jgi:ribosomal protein L7/L12
MSLLLLIVVVVLVILVCGVVLVAVLATASSRKGSSQPMGYAPAPPPPPAGYAGHSPYQTRAGISAPALAEVQTLLARGKKIQAIKVVREETRMGLKDAKDYVDAMLGGGLAPALPGAVSWGQQPGGGLLSERARTFKAAGDLASAVALVRAETGMSQSEAERFINALD